MTIWINLVRAGLKPGANLQHNESRPVPVDGLILLGRIRNPYVATLVKIRLGRLDRGADFRNAVSRITRTVFQRNKWKFTATRSDVSPMMLRSLFLLQCAREFVGDQCAACKGRGVVGRSIGGRKEDDSSGAVRACAACDGTTIERDRTSSRARALRLSRAAISKTWDERIDATVHEMSRLSMQAEDDLDRATR